MVLVRSVSLRKCQNRANCERNLKFCTEFLDVASVQNSEGSNFFGHSKWLKQPKWLYQPMVNISRLESDISLIFVLNDTEYMVSHRCFIWTWVVRSTVKAKLAKLSLNLDTLQYLTIKVSYELAFLPFTIQIYGFL